MQRQVRAIERGGALAEGGLEEGHDAFRLGVPALDEALPWGGLARSALHEIADRSVDGAGLGFASALLVRLLRTRAAEEDTESSVLWCVHTHQENETGALYGPGLAAFGLDPSRLIFVRVKRAADVLWVMREGLSCHNIAAVVGEGAAADLNDSRRLQLAAEANGTTAFLLRPNTLKAAPSAALTRWSVGAAPSGPVFADPSIPVDDSSARALGFGPTRWHLHLERCRGGVPKEWLVEWRPETGLFAPIRDEPASVEPPSAEPRPFPAAPPHGVAIASERAEAWGFNPELLAGARRETRAQHTERLTGSVQREIGDIVDPERDGIVLDATKHITDRRHLRPRADLLLENRTEGRRGHIRHERLGPGEPKRMSAFGPAQYRNERGRRLPKRRRHADIGIEPGAGDVQLLTLPKRPQFHIEELNGADRNETSQIRDGTRLLIDDQLELEANRPRFHDPGRR